MMRIRIYHQYIELEKYLINHNGRNNCKGKEYDTIKSTMRANIIYIAIPITIHEQQSYGGRFCPIDSRKPYQHNNN